jgi:Spy/CpxP family protein refolding chaperone
MDIFEQKRRLVYLVLFLTFLNVSAIGIFTWKDINSKKQPLPSAQTYDNGRYEPMPPPPRNAAEMERNKKDEPGRPPRNDEGRDVTTILEKQLDLTEKQTAQFRDIRNAFFEKEKILGRIIRDERDSMNVEMFNKNTNEDNLKKLARSVSDHEYSMELLRIEQARQLKAICTPQQQEKFQNLVIEIRDYFRPDNGSHRID